MTLIVIMVLNDNSTSTDNISKVPDVESNGLMNEISNAMRVQLGLLSILAGTTSMAQVVKAATLQM